MNRLIIAIISGVLLLFSESVIMVASENNNSHDYNDVKVVRPVADGYNDIYHPFLEVGKRTVYKKYYFADPDRPHPTPFYEVMIGEKIQENGKEIFISYYRNANETDFSRGGKNYEENGILYKLYPGSTDTFIPIYDMTLPIGYVLPETFISVANKRHIEIEGTERLVLEFVGDYVRNSYYWIEGIGSLPELFLSYYDFPVADEGSQIVACYMGEECIFDADSFMAEMTSAKDFKPTTRPDRIWECVSDDGDSVTVKYLKFDGTDYLDNILFHRIVTFAKSKTKSTSDLANAEYDYLEDVYEYEGYMREADGKAYTWLKGEYRDNRFYGSLYTPEASYPANYESSEKLLYDFTCEPGDCLGAYSNMGDYGTFTGFDIISKSTVTVGDEECIMLEVRPAGAGDDSPTYFIVEGIGPVDFGCLSYNEYLNPQANTVSTNHFNRLLDENGNVLFRNPRGCIDFKLPEHLFSSVKAIDEYAHIEISGGMIFFGENGNLNEAAIIDLSGRIVKSARANTRLSLTTSDLTPGVYIATATANGRSAARRKIIVR